MLLTCAALAVAQSLLLIACLPALGVLAPASPPLYAVAAGVYTIMPFLARRATEAFGSATITAAMAGVMVAAVSPIGFVAAALMVVPSVIVDMTVSIMAPSGVSARRRESAYLVAAVAAAAVLFAVSLLAFSAEHLVPVVMIGALVGRVVGEVAMAVLSRLLFVRLRRAGVLGEPRPRARDAKGGAGDVEPAGRESTGSR